MNKKIAVSAVTIALLGTTMVGGSTIFAQTSTVSTPLVQKIAEKFNLNKDDVQAVFDQNREEHQQAMQQRSEDRLNQLVRDGKITEEQKKLMITKRQELQTERQMDRENFKNLTPEQRRTENQNRRTEIEAWAKKNNIDPSYLMNGMGPEGHHGMRDMDGDDE